jgi:hypothetical protein
MPVPLVWRRRMRKTSTKACPASDCSMVDLTTVEEDASHMTCLIEGVVKDGEHKLLELHLHCKEQLLRHLRAPPPVEEDEEESGQVGNWQRTMAVLRVSMLLGQVGFYGFVLNVGQASPLYVLISVGLMSLLFGQPKWPTCILRIALAVLSKFSKNLNLGIYLEFKIYM